MNKYLAFIGLFFLCSTAFSQEIELPNILTIDSVRLDREPVKPGDTVARGSLVFFGQTPGGNKVSTSTPVMPISLINERIFLEIEKTIAINASLTGQYLEEARKIKGLNQFQKIIRQTSEGNKRYEELAWLKHGRFYQGRWSINTASGQHTFSVSENGSVRRASGTPVLQGRFIAQAQNRVVLRNYLSANQDIVLDRVADGVFASVDGSVFIVKIE